MAPRSNDRADVVVVGGGIIGCAAAYALARSGASVILVERDDLAAGASGRNHGLLLAPLDPALVPMADASTALYEALVPKAPLPVHLDPRPVGFLIVAAAEDERAAAEEEARAAQACGVRIERVEGSSLRALEPELATGPVEGWLLEDARRLDPAALTVAMGLAAADLGADVRRHVPVRALLADGDAVVGVATDDGSIQAATVVVAAGPWTAALLRPLGLHLAVAGARGWLVHLAPAWPVVSRLVGQAGWHAVPGREVTPPALAGDLARGGPGAFLSPLVQPNPDGTLLVGGSRQWAVTPEPEDPGVPGEIIRRAAALLPAVARAPVLSAWWGVRPMTPDGRPAVGFVRPGLLVATGHGSQGVILGGGTGALVASLVAGGDAPFDPAPFRPERLLSSGSRERPKLL